MTDTKIAVVTDSTADIPPEIITEYNIQMVPAILVINGKSLQDGAEISRQQFYERLPLMQPPPTTSAPSAGAFLEIYDKIFAQGYQQVISIHAASTLSGIYNAARLAAQTYDQRVWVVDSQQVTLGLGFQAMAAMEAIRNGAALTDVIALLDQLRRRVVVIAMLDTLEYVRRSGRVSWARASLGALLNIKPFVELKDGIVRRMGEARTRQKGIERLLSLLNELGSLERLGILHTNAESDAHDLLATVASRVPVLPPVVNVTTVIGTHVGPNALGFVAVRKY